MSGLLTPAFLEEVRARTALVDLVAESVPLRRAGREMKGCCPFHHEKTPSFHVIEAKGFFHCFGCGAHGTAVDWVMRTRGLDFRAAVMELAARAGMTADAPRPAPVVARPAAAETDADARAQQERARGLWRTARPAAGSPVAAYLRARGITIDPPPTLRWAPDLAVWGTGRDRPRLIARADAMVAPLVQADGRVSGVHLTWLAPGGTGKAAIVDPATGERVPAKKMRGEAWAAAIRLAPAGAHLGLAEGIETALSVMQATGLPCWAAASLGNLAGRGDPAAEPTPHPEKPGRWVPTARPDPGAPGLRLPDGVRTVTLLGDGDADPWVTAALLERAARRFRATGARVRIAVAPAGKDFNDLVRG
jgi:DNA primase